MGRGTSPVVAIVLLIAITVVGVAGIASIATGLSAEPASRPGPTIAVSVDADAQRIAVAHRGGRPLDLRNHSVAIRIDGDPLARQPPVPYFAAPGFRGTPTGAFNAAAEPTLDPGERASLQLAATNAPRIEPGDAVTFVVRRDGRRVAAATVEAG